MTNEKIRLSLLTLAQAMTTQVNTDSKPRLNVLLRVLYGYCMEGVYKDESSVFLRSKVGEDPQNFLYEVYKIVNVIGVTYELASYQLKEVAQIWFTQ